MKSKGYEDCCTIECVQMASKMLAERMQLLAQPQVIAQLFMRSRKRAGAADTWIRDLGDRGRI